MLAAGEVVAFPAGPAGTHQVLNRAAEPARVLICATTEVPEVAEQIEEERTALAEVAKIARLRLDDRVTDRKEP